MFENRLAAMADRMRNPNENGWYFSVGNPEFWRYKKELIRPGGRVLDLGIGGGRSSTFFAINEMTVEGIDIDQDSVDFVNEQGVSMGLPISARQADIRTVDLPNETYDVVLLDYALVHFNNRKDALTVFGKAYDATAKGGYLWIRTIGVGDDQYDRKHSIGPYGQVSEGVRWAMCNCSGVAKIEPELYLPQTGLLQFATSKGMKIVHSESMPRYGQTNIMFGEDFGKWQDEYRTTGHITLLAQKV